MSKTIIPLILSWLACWACAARAGDRVLLEFDAKHSPPSDWKVQGFAFGTHDPEQEYRQRAAVASRNQRQYQTGRMISPEFVIDDDYLQVACSGVFHPTYCAVVLVVDGKMFGRVLPNWAAAFWVRRKPRLATGARKVVPASRPRRNTRSTCAAARKASDARGPRRTREWLPCDG